MSTTESSFWTSLNHTIDAILFPQAVAEEKLNPELEVDVSPEHIESVIEQQIIPEIEKDAKSVARWCWKVLKEMWYDLPSKYRNIIKFIIFATTLSIILLLPFMLYIMHSIYSFFRNNPQYLLAL